MKCANILLEKRNMKTLASIDEYHKVFGFPIKEYYRRLGFDFEKEPYEDLANEWAKYYDRFSADCMLCDGVYETVSDISGLGIKQVVISMQEICRLNLFLERFGIRKYFDEVIGLDNIYAETKINIAKKWLEHRGCEYNIISVGDTEHDFYMAKELGIDCVLVCGGHQAKETLLKCGGVVIDNISDLIKRDII